MSGRLTAQNVATTIAGIDPTFSGNGQPGVNVPLGYVNGVATDSNGNVYFTDPLEHLVLEVSSTGILSVVAGNGIAGYSGDGGPATSAAIAASDSPEQYTGPLYEDSLGGIAIDSQGNVYFADGHRVRQVATDGTITTVAGGGTLPGDGEPATQASLGIVNGLAFDSGGNLYFSEGNRVRMMTTGGTLSTYAGTGSNGFSGDGGPAIAAQLSQPLGLVFDAKGNLYVADGDVINFASRIRKISTTGAISTVAGGGNNVPENGASPLTLNLSFASGLAVDASGALYVFSPYGGSLLKFSGGSTTIITSPVPAPFASNVPVRDAYVVGQRPYDNSGIAFDGAGNLYVADSRGGYLCKIGTTGVLTAVAGNGAYGYGGDGGPALGALLQAPAGITDTPSGTIYFVDRLNARVRAISPTGIVSTVLSAANFPPLGNLEVLNGITSDPSGNVYVALARRVVEITPSGDITIILNQAGAVADSGDGGPATQGAVLSLGGVTRDASGDIYVSDPSAHRIREITPDGKIHTAAGTGTLGVSPDGAVAAVSPLQSPSSLLADSHGGLYFEESPPSPAPLGDSVLRYITPSGVLKTIAGNGNPNGAFSGDGGPALQAGLAMGRTGMALDKGGNLYFTDGFHSRVRVIAPSGTINTLAGNGQAVTAGDGGPASEASFVVPDGLLFDAAGDLVISDAGANRIRAVLAAPPAIAVSPSQLSFSATAGGAQTPPQKLTISGPVSGVAFSVSTSADWLVVEAGGFTPRLLDVRADPSTLTAGAYQGAITINSPLSNPVTTQVPVTFQVAPAVSPELSVDHTGLSFTFPSQPTTAETRTVRVSNAGSQSLAFTAAAQTNNGGAWLKVSPVSGAATPNSPSVLSITANPTGLATGTYTGSVTISSSTNSSTAGQSVTVRVTATVSTQDQAIQVSHPGLSFTAVSGGGVIPPGGFAVNNIGRGSMTFAVSTSTLSGGPWLTATPASASALAGSPAPRVTVKVSPGSLAPGFYYGLVRVDAVGVANAPQVVTVALRVLPAGQDPGPVIQPNELIFTAEEGAPSPGSQNLLVYNVSGTSATYVSSVTASTSNDNFSFIPENSTLSLAQPTRIVVQPLTSGLAPGVYSADLTLQFSDGYVRRVGMRTIVTPPALSAPAASLFAAHSVTGCIPSQLVPSITTLGQSFGVPAAWPVALEAQVSDDCGNPLTSGGVTASFSNGDAPLSLVSTQDGTWQTTWQSTASMGPVTVTINANDPARNLTGTSEVTGGLVDSSPAPVLNAAVSGASFAANTPLAPRSIVSLFGLNMANGTASASTLPLGTVLSGATIDMAGEAMPLLFSSGGQINAVVPGGLNGNTSQQIIVERGNTLSVPISVDVGPAEPAIFVYPAQGDPATQGAIVNALTYVVAEPATPVSAGAVLAIFCTGLGAVNQTVADGVGAPSSPLAYTVANPTVTVGGENAQVTFSGLSPGFVGLYQIDAVVPAGVSTGNAVPVVVSIDGASSPAVTIAVK